MAKKLKLHTEHSKFRVRLHAVVLLVIILASLAVGFVAGKQGLFGNNVAANNCIPQTDFQFFLDDANEVKADYQQCVADLWNLQLSYKMAAAKAQKALRNSTSNSSLSK